MLVAIWHMLTGHAVYQDLGGGYFTRLNQTEPFDAH
jgi:hypothetical protein